eukprot:6193222-Pleurochrysis_carterae.AAC.2
MLVCSPECAIVCEHLLPLCANVFVGLETAVYRRLSASHGMRDIVYWAWRAMRDVHGVAQSHSAHALAPCA